MIVIVADDCIIVDFFEEAAFEVNKVFPLNFHYAHEAVHESLNFLVVVQFVCDDGGHAQHPCAFLETDFAFGSQTVADEEAQGKVDEEGLRSLVDH